MSSRKCLPGCTCKRHEAIRKISRPKCPEGCTCKRHKQAGNKCLSGCTCKRHSRSQEVYDRIGAKNKGSHHSEETKQLMSSIKKEQVANGTFIPWIKGKTKETAPSLINSDETRKKKSESHIGTIGWKRGLTKETDQRVANHAISLGRFNLTPLNQKVRSCLEYVKWRTSIFQRDSYTCQICKEKGKRIVSHHIIPLSFILFKNNIKTIDEALICNEIWNINNGCTLCNSCHKKTETFGMNAKKFKESRVANDV